MNRSENIADLAAALAKAQGQMRHALKDHTNPHLKSKYADLASVLDACREPLASNGLSVTQLATYRDNEVAVESVLMHASGQHIASTIYVPVNRADAHGVGSALTYARRYALAALVGVAQDDDDANSATSGDGSTGGPTEPQPAKPIGPRTEAQVKELGDLLMALGIPDNQQFAKVTALAKPDHPSTQAGAGRAILGLRAELDKKVGKQ